MDANEPAVVIRRVSGWMWVSQIILLIASFCAAGLAITMFISDDLGEAMLDGSEARVGRMLAALPAPWPPVLLALLGAYGFLKFAAGIRLLTGMKPVLFMSQGVQGIAIGAQAVGGREKALEVPRDRTVVLSAKRVTRFRGGFVRMTVIRVDTEGAYLEVETTFAPRQLDASPLERAVGLYSIRFANRM